MAKKAALVPEVMGLEARPWLETADDPLAQELREATREALSVREFFGRMSQFFAKAKVVEDDAVATLAVVKAVQAPTTAEEDAAIVRRLQAVKDKAKAAEDLWVVRQQFHGLHKRFVAGFGRASTPLTQAAAILQAHHNAYKAKAEREAEEKRRRLQAEEDARARAKREAELAELEAAAVAAEEASGDLSDRECFFITAYVSGHNGQQAATIAGYKDPFKAAARLLSHPKIRGAIRARQDAEAIRQQAQAVQAAPLDAVAVEVKADVLKVGSERKTRSAKCHNPQQLIASIVDGNTLGIPVDCLMVDETKLNTYARSLGKLINAWPGVTYVETGTTV